MIPFLRQIKNHFDHYYRESEEVYCQPYIVNIERDFSKYSFLQHYPDQQKVIDQLFARTVLFVDQQISISSILQADHCHLALYRLIREEVFSHLGHHGTESGVTLKHRTDLKGWFIKKNFSYESDNSPEGFIKTVTAKDFPFWMVPRSLMSASSLPIKILSGLTNPLRAVISERGRYWISKLKFKHVRMVEEYLYELPGTPLEYPLHRRVVALSKEEQVVSQMENLQRFVNMAKQNPEKLSEIAREICLLIKHVRLIDNQLNDIRFLDDETDTVIFLDAEPIGGMADVSSNFLELTGKEFQTFDPGFFPLVGLKVLQTNISLEMTQEGIKADDIRLVQDIFDQVINQTIEGIIRERRSELIKQYSYRLCPFLPLTLLIKDTFQMTYQRWIIPFFTQQPAIQE